MKYWDGGHFILWRSLLASEVCLSDWGFVVSHSFLGAVYSVLKVYFLVFECGVSQDGIP